MKESKTYTAKEVAHNINTLNNRMDILKLDRKFINQDINQVKKQIVSWEELDSSQFKMF